MPSPGFRLTSIYFLIPIAFFLLLVVTHAMQGERNGGLLSDIKQLNDPSRKLGLDQVLAMDPARFRPVRGRSINPGYTKDAIWLRLTVENDRSRPALLSLSPNFLDLVDFYIGKDRSSVTASDFVHVAMGDHRPIPADGVSGLDNSVPLDLVAGEPVLVYIRLAAVNSTLTTDIALYSQEEHIRRTTITAVAAGLWFGSMAVLIVIQFVFFYFDRRPHYLLLAAATFVAMLVYVGTLGFSRLFLFQNGGLGNDIYTAGTTWLGLAAGPLAGDSIFDLRKRAPILHRLLMAASGVGLIGVVCAALGANMAFVPFGNVASIGVTTLIMLYGIYSADENGSATRLRAIAYLVLWCGVIATFAQRGGFVDLPNWVSHIYAVACVVQTILLTAALGVRLRAAEALNHTMRDAALAAAKRAEQRAQAMVEERTQELAAAREVAEAALAAELASQEHQVRFMEVISHQYRTPLAAVRTHVDNIGLSFAKDDLVNQKRLARARRGIARLVEVLEVNLSRARLQGSSFQPELVRMSLASIVEAATMRARDLLQGEIRTEIDTECNKISILADGDMMDIAIINLLENAVKFSTCADIEPVILSCRLEGDHATISISDRGIGIPADEIEQVFMPRRRGTNATGVEGTGMGLSQVSRIVAAHGGTICVESCEGQGTSVVIRLPIL